MYMNIKWHFTDEHRIAISLIGSNTFTPGEKKEMEGLSNHTLSG